MLKKSLTILSLFAIVSCGSSVQLTDLAAQAMERAKAAEADVYAPKEYKIASGWFTKMNNALANDNSELANEHARIVIDKANEAINIARKNKAAALIAQLKKALANDGIKRDFPDNHRRASNFLTSAQSAYDATDYEKAISDAQKGLDLLNVQREGQLYTVVKDDTLWDLSDKFYSTPMFWPHIFDANRDRIKDSHWIYPKQEIIIPAKPNN